MKSFLPILVVAFLVATIALAFVNWVVVSRRSAAD